MKAWFDDPQQLVRADQVNQFWPTNDQTPEDRVNAASRFVIYVCTILYLIRRDPRVFVLGATVLAVIYVLYKSRMVKETYGGSVEGVSCQMPTPDNPMGNVMITDFSDAPNRLEACYYPTVKPFVNSYTSDRIPYDAGRSRSPMPKYLRNAMERQFVSNPVTKIPGDQTALRNLFMGENMLPCVKVTPASVIPTLVVFSSRHFLVSVVTAISVLACLLDKYSYVIINGISTSTWTFHCSKCGCRSPVKATDEIFVYPQPSTLNCGVADPTLCCTALPLTWRARVHQHSISKLVINSALNLLPDLTSISFRHTSETFSLSNMECKVPLRTDAMSPRVPEPNSRMVCFSKVLNKNVNKK